MRGRPHHIAMIDVLKGALIIAVITGHILQGRLSRNFFRFLIYSFHMPLFFATSGYLLSYSLPGSLSGKALIKKYYGRVVQPWLVAWAAYSVLAVHDSLTIETVVDSLIFPYYHLWYVPTLIVFIIVLRLCTSGSVTPVILLSVSALLVIPCEVMLSLEDSAELSGFVKDFCNVYKPHYFLFFLLGFLITRVSDLKRYTAGFIAAGAAGLVWRIISFWENHISVLNIDFYVLNISLILVLLLNLDSIRVKKNAMINIIKWIGRNSLPIYLWHVIVIMGCKSLATQHIGTFHWYLFTVILSCLFISSVYVASKISWFDSILFGRSCSDRSR
ncbi:MAG: acyltransferase [Desulfobacterales bacterium]|nr:acyltransferase [Desulfobacterales bacterium]MDD4072958.1 acyltransferase [Desulfobacterales bacterium]